MAESGADINQAFLQRIRLRPASARLVWIIADMFQEVGGLAVDVFLDGEA
jgi:hypothetical protein